MNAMNLIKLVGLAVDFIGEHPLGVTQAIVGGLVAQFLAAHTFGGHHDRLAERAERWKRQGEPVPGFGSFAGRVISLRDPAEDPPVLHVDERDGFRATAERRAPVVERVRTQRLAGRDTWIDVGVSTRADPFRLELESGHELEVLPGAKPGLSGFEVTAGHTGRLREVRSAVYPDERVWVTGYLEPPPKGAGAYRGAGGSPRKLRAPRGQALMLTREPPAEEWRRLARAHRTGGWAALASLGIAAAAAYREVFAPLFSEGPGALPHLPASVVLLWALLAVAAPIVWATRVQAARRAWAKRFPWL